MLVSCIKTTFYRKEDTGNARDHRCGLCNGLDFFVQQSGIMCYLSRE